MKKEVGWLRLSSLKNGSWIPKWHQRLVIVKPPQQHHQDDDLAERDRMWTFSVIPLDPMCFKVSTKKFVSMWLVPARPGNIWMCQ